MFNAVSIEPAPIPNGTAQIQSHKKFCEKENPSSAIAVRLVDSTVTRGVPTFAITCALNKLERTVPHEIITETKLA